MHLQFRSIFWAALLLLGAAAIWRISSLPDFQLMGELIHHVDIEDKLIALTFDDGPEPSKTEQILAILAKEQVKATFFLVGEPIQRNPQLLKQILQAGHQVGNHSYSHQRMVFKSKVFISSEIEKTDQLLLAAGAAEPLLFRPPYGKKFVMLPWYLHQKRRLSVTWDVAPEDFPQVAADPTLLAKYTIEHTKPGSIILLHVMYESRANSMAAAPLIIAGLKQLGFQFVTVSELLAHRAAQLARSTATLP